MYFNLSNLLIFIRVLDFLHFLYYLNCARQVFMINLVELLSDFKLSINIFSHFLHYSGIIQDSKILWCTNWGLWICSYLFFVQWYAFKSRILVLAKPFRWANLFHYVTMAISCNIILLTSSSRRGKRCWALDSDNVRSNVPSPKAKKENPSLLACHHSLRLHISVLEKLFSSVTTYKDLLFS